MKQYGFDFERAISELTGFSKFSANIERGIRLNTKEFTPTFSFNDVSLSTDERRVMAYLKKTRGISSTIIMDFIKRKFLFQESKTHNALFAVYNENHSVVGVEVEGTLSQVKFKGLKKGSNHRYGFSVPMDGSNIKYVLFFESAVDLMSFIEIERLRCKPLTGCLLVSLAGLKQETLENTLHTLTNGAECVMCVDNDIAGQTFTKGLKTQMKSIVEHFPDKRYKDWNEQLKATKNM